ncbi:OprD family outer membrane porin [Sulfurimonas sp.]
MKFFLMSAFSLFFISQAYAMHDYRCSAESLCEEHSSLSVNTLQEAFTNAKVDGHVRFAYITQDNAATKDTYATAFGGELKFETARYLYTSVAVSTYISQKLNGLSGTVGNGDLNPDFFGANGESITYLGEAYIDYNHNKFDIRVGRQQLDTPLNDRDDIRMLPNTFEAVTLGYGGIKDFVFMAGYITKWAGYDSGDDISKFKLMPGDIAATGERGRYVTLAGVMNESIKNLELQVWYYGFDKLNDVVYADSLYNTKIEKISFEGGLQLSHYFERSSSEVDGTVYGATANVSYKNFSLGIALNKAHTTKSAGIILGYGGGPYYTSMEEMTIADISDVEAYVLSLGLVVANDLEFSYAYGHFDGTQASATTKYKENDFILNYSVNKKLDMELSFADVKDEVNSGINDTSYNRILFRVNYSFGK